MFKKIVFSGFIFLSVHAFSQNQFPLNLDYAQIFVQQNPSNTYYLSCLAMYQEKNTNWNEAIRLSKLCLDIEPDESKHYIKLARVYKSSGRPDLGKKVITNALYYFDKNPDVITVAGDMEYELGFFQKAVSNYNLALKYKPADPSWVYEGLGKAYRELKRFDLSEGFFLKSLEKKPDLWAFYEYGKLLADKQNYPRAVWAFSKARDMAVKDNDKYSGLLNQKLSGAYYSFGMQLKEVGNKKQAKEVFNHILRDEDLSKTAFAEKAAFWLKRI